MNPAHIFSLDSSCMVAAVCSWHERHRAAAAAVEARLAGGQRLAVPAHALAEAYAVLTRLPAPHRLAPADAWTLIEANFIRPARVVALDGPSYVRVLRRLAGASLAGGRTYDEVIAESVHRAGAQVLLTLNPRHFDPPPAGVSVVDPSVDSA